MNHKSHRLNVVSTANTPASVDLQQNFSISDSCFSVYSKAIYDWSVTVTVFKKETESLWARNNVWRWSLACSGIVLFVLCSSDFRIALCWFLICFKFHGSFDIEFDCTGPPDSSSRRSYTSWGGLLAVKSVSWRFNIVGSVRWYGRFCLELPCSLTSRSCTVLE